MGFKVREIVDKKEEEEISREVLYDLPEWFGIPKSTEAYIADSIQFKRDITKSTT